MAEIGALRTKLGGTIRESLQRQGEAYRSYGELLARLGSQDLKVLEFAREAADLYIGAVRDAASSGVHVASDIAAAGTRLLGAARTRSTKAAARAGSKAAGGAISRRGRSAKPRSRRTKVRTTTPSTQA